MNKRLKPEVLAEAVRDLDSDDVVDLLEDLEEDQQTQILNALDDGMIGSRLNRPLPIPRIFCGSFDAAAVVKIMKRWTVGRAIDFMRRQQGLPDPVLSYRFG